MSEATVCPVTRNAHEKNSEISVPDKQCRMPLATLCHSSISFSLRYRFKETCCTIICHRTAQRQSRPAAARARPSDYPFDVVRLAFVNTDIFPGVKSARGVNFSTAKPLSCSNAGNFRDLIHMLIVLPIVVLVLSTFQGSGTVKGNRSGLSCFPLDRKRARDRATA